MNLTTSLKRSLFSVALFALVVSGCSKAKLSEPSGDDFGDPVTVATQTISEIYEGEGFVKIQSSGDLSSSRASVDVSQGGLHSGQSLGVLICNQYPGWGAQFTAGHRIGPFWWENAGCNWYAITAPAAELGTQICVVSFRRRDCPTCTPYRRQGYDCYVID